MSKAIVLTIASASLLVLASVVPAKAPKTRDILSFETMYGVDGPFVGDANPIRDIVGDEALWEVKSVRGTLRTNGRLTLHVHGLVFKDDPRAPEGFVGKNDEPTFKAVVSCLTEESETAVGMQNVETDEFPASLEGDSDIEQTLTLPNPCVAPIVFVIAGSEEKWFSVTGVETASD